MIQKNNIYSTAFTSSRPYSVSMCPEIKTETARKNLKTNTQQFFLKWEIIKIKFLKTKKSFDSFIIKYLPGNKPKPSVFFWNICVTVFGVKMTIVTTNHGFMALRHFFLFSNLILFKLLLNKNLFMWLLLLFNILKFMFDSLILCLLFLIE